MSRTKLTVLGPPDTARAHTPMTQAVANGKAAGLFDSEQDGTSRVERLDETTDHLLNAGNRAFRVADRAAISFGRRSRQLLGSAFARLGPVSRRDQRIAELDKERRRLAGGPSFQVRLNEERRLRGWESELGAPSRSVIAGGKFHVYDLVRSHGIDVPEQLGRWHDPADIPWDELPDAVVIKSAFGAASRGVLPLRRVDGGWQVATRDATVTSEQLTADLAALASKREVRPPFGAEEFLDDGSGTVPVDIKVYTFYGEAPVARLRRVFEHRPGGSAAHRVVDRNGIDLDDTYRGKPTDPTIPLPGALADLFDVAEHVSIVIRAPFSRIDLYDIRGRIVFGEVTPCPGSPGGFGPDLDVTMGEAWERAQVRLWRDIAEGVSREAEWGPLGAPAGSTSATDARPPELLIGNGG
jgi:TupA-like ATPgrasp